MEKIWAHKEAPGELFQPTPEGYKKRCFTFLYVLCNDKDMKLAATYLAPDCVLLHEDAPPVRGSEAFISTWGTTLQKMPNYHKDMQDMMVELGQGTDGVARVWVYSRIDGITPGVVRDSIDMMHFTADGLFLYSKDVQRDTQSLPRPAQEGKGDGMPSITSAEATAIIAAALKKARDIPCHPMTIAVVDAGGVLLGLKREDGSGALRPDIAFAKAWGPIGMGIGGRAMAERSKKSPEFWASLNIISHGRIAPVPGGVLCLRDGVVVGSVGATGDVPDNDEACALAGAQAAGFTTEVMEEALGKQ